MSKRRLAQFFRDERPITPRMRRARDKYEAGYPDCYLAICLNRKFHIKGIINHYKEPIFNNRPSRKLTRKEADSILKWRIQADIEALVFHRYEEVLV